VHYWYVVFGHSFTFSIYFFLPYVVATILMVNKDYYYYNQLIIFHSLNLLANDNTYSKKLFSDVICHNVI